MSLLVTASLVCAFSTTPGLLMECTANEPYHPHQMVQARTLYPFAAAQVHRSGSRTDIQFVETINGVWNVRVIRITYAPPHKKMSLRGVVIPATPEDMEEPVL